MKVYVNWEWEKIVRTEVEARDFMMANGICFDFNEYLASELDFTLEGVFNLELDEKEAILKQYFNYLKQEMEDCWEIVEIQREGAQALFCAF